MAASPTPVVFERMRSAMRRLSDADLGASPLLRKLRLKFIAVNMMLAALVLTISFATVCYMSYRSDVDEIYRSLNQAVSHTLGQTQIVPNRGPLAFEGPASDQTDQLPRHDQEADRTIGGTDEEPAAEAAPSVPEADAKGIVPSEEQPAEDGAFVHPEIGGRHSRGDAALPIAIYYVENGTALHITGQSSAAVAPNVLPGALTAASHAEADRGYLSDCGLFYARHPSGLGVAIAFADSAEANGWQSLALALAGVGLGALAVLLLLNLLFSKWALGPIQRAWTQQQQFIADASHELKTPLTVILANNAILRQRANETIASQGQWIESTQMEAERMQGLVTDMLDLARPAPALAAGDAAPPVDFSRLVEGEALTFESVAFEHALTWETAVDEGIAVRGDARRLQRLVAVLLDNACKYTEAHGRVTVRLTTEERTAVLTVNNTGEPIDKGDLPHLFDRFYRADKARTHGGANENGGGAAEGATPGGYGLGLAIAQDIARASKGTLTAASTAEAGTTFTLRLPLASS